MGNLSLHDLLACLDHLTAMLSSPASDSSPQQIMARLDASLCSATGAQDWTLALLGQPDDDLAIIRRPTPLSPSAGPHLPIDWLPSDDTLRSVSASGSPCWVDVEDCREASASSLDPDASGQRCSALLLPIRAQEKTIGILGLYVLAQSESWRQEATSVAQTVAGQLGILLARNREARRRARSESLYQSIFDGISEGALVIDLSGRLQAANGAASELFQYSREELLAMDAGQLVVTSGRSAVSPSGEAIQALESSPSHCDIRRKDGTIASFEVSSYPMPYNGQLMRLALFRDVRASRRMEAQLRHRLAQLESLYAMGLEITAELTTKTILERIVERATTLVGADFGGIFIYDEEQDVLVLQVAQKLPEVYLGTTFAPGEDVPGTVFQTGHPTNIHAGSEHYAQISGWPGLGITSALVVPMTWGERRIGVLAVTHTQERHRFTKEDEYVVGLKANHASIAIIQSELFHELQQTAEELRQANLELQELDRMKDHLLAMVTHELRRPLSSARLNLELVQDSPRGLGRQEHELLQSALRSIDAQTEMVDALLQAAQIGTLPLADKTPHDLRELVAAAVSEAEASAHEAAVRLSSRMPNSPIICSVDPGGLGRALANLISNAIKFTPEEGQVHIELERKDGVASIAVHDTGIGIPAKYHKRIFSKFFQVDSRPRRAYDGIGLGLPIAKEIVDQHCGSLRVESQEGRGSCFTIELPYLP